MKDTHQFKIHGHITITDPETGEILVDKDNAIHYENFSVALCQSLIGGPIQGTNPGFIYSMNFGNGGTTVDSAGIITYNPPNVVGGSAQLYNQTYTKIVNNQFSADLNPITNNITYTHVQGKPYSDITVVCRLDYGEPAGQLAFDNSNYIKSQYSFDEIGLYSYNGTLLTHVIFNPFIKSLNRLADITYVLRIYTLSSINV